MIVVESSKSAFSDQSTAEAAAICFPIVSADRPDAWIQADSPAAAADALNAGAAFAVVPHSLVDPENQLTDLPRSRLAVWLPLSALESVHPIAQKAACVLIDARSSQLQAAEILASVQAAKPPADVRIAVALADPANLAVDPTCPFELVVPADVLVLDQAPPKHKIDMAAALAARTKSDRPDGLITTVVADEHGVALGLVYSSVDSIRAALVACAGVYYSRSRGIWHKGLSSGATQKLLRIDCDCDGDALRFTVVQTPPGFCHLNTRTCFGADSGITRLFHELVDRKASAPQGSYTKRLFDDPALLTAKIREEADELCDASAPNDIAWETADLIYFALVKCVASGVSLADVERHLDMRSKKITRRPGNAKPKYTSQPDPKLSQPPAQPTQNVPEKKFEMRHVTKSQLSPAQISDLLKRPIIKTDEIMNRVRPIVDSVRSGGDAALSELTAKFDRVSLAPSELVLRAPFDPSLMNVETSVKVAIDLAYENIYKFHDAQMDRSTLTVETMPGVVCTRIARPIERVGLYVPGGTAVLPSTTLMLGVPAKVAGCSQIVVASPPRSDGSIAPEIVYVASKIGATSILKAGGAQAVAALAYGTESVPKVDKIFGPGNQYVTAAKMVTQSDSSALVAIDMPAGPSELLVIADTSANLRYVVADLLSQAEHGVDSQVVLVAVGFDSNRINAFRTELFQQASALPRADIVNVSLSKSVILSVDTMDEAINFSNDYAPEHLILNVLNPGSYIPRIQHAGSVFLGPYSPESCGDYASGTNHTLPTYGYARMYSGVNTQTFLKHITTQELTVDGLDRIGDCVATLAKIEGLDAHRNAVLVRLADMRK